jgi:transcriptional regulator with XRE-family HTH domain
VASKPHNGEVLREITAGNESAMIYKPLCALRMHRRVWGLTQKELAKLLGLRSQGHMADVENSKCAPTVRSALACQVLFGIPPATMFPHLYDRVEERVVREVYERHEALSDTTSPKGLRKRDLFAQALHRASTPSNPEDDAEPVDAA